MEVMLARHAGACYGVQRALDLAVAVIDEGREVRTLGPLIHNPLVVSDLERRGARVAASVADIAKIGHIDLLINNAGQPSFKTPTAYEAADVDKCLKGLKGMILWCVQTLKACDEQNLKIANVMSTAATRGNANESVYCATKWGENCLLYTSDAADEL